jgi:hypothetical protein
MSIKNTDVVHAWYKGRPLSTRNLLTDGCRLYSYKLLIGERLRDGGLILYDFTAGGLGSVSTTTSRHVKLARVYADVCVSRADDYERIKGTKPWDDVSRAMHQ